MSSIHPSSSPNANTTDDSSLSRQHGEDSPSQLLAGREPALRQTSSHHDSSPSPQQSLPRRSLSERVPHYRSSVGPHLNHDLPPLPRPDLSPEARRQTMMALDRKRRLTASTHETGRRRTTTGGFTSRDNRYYQITPRRDSQPSSASQAGAGDQGDVVDLTSSSPPAPPSGDLQSTISPRQHRTRSSSSRGYAVPRWQPDNEVSECPICHRQFGFLFRRHHCRKCGRVVCNDCSPHRITIPRQYIVHPPGTMEDPLSPTDIPIIDLTRADDGQEGTSAGLPYRRPNPALGGGEKVRLCNPCVPDPQPELLAMPREPPQGNSYFAAGQSREPFGRPLNHLQRPAPPTLTEFPPYQYPQNRRPTQPTESDRQLYARLQHPGTRVHLELDEEDEESGSSPEAYTSAPRHHIMVSTSPPTFIGNIDHAQSLSQHHFPPHAPPPTHSRYRSLDSPQAPLPPLPLFNSRPRNSSMLDPTRDYYGMPPPSFSSGVASRPSQPAPSSSTTAPRPARHRIREEDMCPVCRHELPPKGPNADETERENHIMQCISQHDTSTPTQRQPPSALHSNMSASLPAEPWSRTQTFGASGPTLPVSSSHATSSSTPPAPVRMHVPGMIRFIATEKDCTPQPNSDGQLDESSVECSICMVEYEVGERLVRLECWCKFHEECIVEWVGRGGGCPLHKINS